MAKLSKKEARIPTTTSGDANADLFRVELRHAGFVRVIGSKAWRATRDICVSMATYDWCVRAGFAMHTSGFRIFIGGCRDPVWI